MKRLLMLAWFAALSTLPFTQVAQAGHSEYDLLIATHAAANNVPELVHRVICARAATSRTSSGAAAASG